MEEEPKILRDEKVGTLAYDPKIDIDVSASSLLNNQEDIDKFTGRIWIVSIVVFVAILLLGAPALILYKDSMKASYYMSQLSDPVLDDIERENLRAEASADLITSLWDSKFDKAIGLGYINRFDALIANIRNNKEWRTDAATAKELATKHKWEEKLRELDEAVAARTIQPKKKVSKGRK